MSFRAVLTCIGLYSVVYGLYGVVYVCIDWYRVA